MLIEPPHPSIAASYGEEIGVRKEAIYRKGVHTNREEEGNEERKAKREEASKQVEMA